MRQIAGVALLLALCASAGTVRAQDVTLLKFNSEPGDYIGQGLDFTLTPSDGTIVAHRMGGGVEVDFSSATSWWYLTFVPRAGENLTPGVYEGVTRWPFQSPTTGGLSVFGNGRGCNTLTGRFTVLEAEYGSGGEVLRLAVDYEQHCEGGGPALFGQVRFDSSVPTVPQLGVGSSARYEGDAGTSNMLFVVSLSAPAETVVTVDFQSVDGTAAAGSDFLGVSGTATFPVGETTVTVPVPVLGDEVEELDEAFTLSLSNGAGASIAFGQGLGAILNDDPDETFMSFNSEPGDWVGQGRQFTLTQLDGDFTFTRPGGGIAAHFDGSTWWDVILVPPAGATLTPGAYEGATRYPFQSPMTPGLDVSGDGRGCNTLTGRFIVHEAEYGASGDVLKFAADYEQHCEGGAPALFGSVRYNSSVPLGTRLVVSGIRSYEGDAGSSSLGFVIALSAPAQTVVTVEYQTADGTATAGSDYTAVSGTATFPVGETAVIVPVPVLGDLVEEADETFTLSLSNAVGAPVAFGVGQGTILNDDPFKTLIYFNSEPGDWVGGGQHFTRTLADGTFAAGRVSGGVHIGFDGEEWWDVYLVAPGGAPLTTGVYLGAERWPFQPSGSPGLSVSGDGRGCNTLTGRFAVLEAEYGPGGEVLRFAAEYEQHCEGGAPALYGSVRFNSTVPRVLRLFLAGPSVVEGNSGTRNLDFPVWLSEPSGLPVTASFATEDVTALQGIDYAGYSGSTIVPAGETDGAIHVPVFGDTLAEADETFSLTLLGAVGAATGIPSEVLGTILDDDALPEVSVADASVVEGDPGPPAAATFVVSLNAPSGQTVSVSYATQQGSATLGEDFAYTSGTLEITAGTTSGTIDVPIVSDQVTEADETFALLLFSPVNATVADGQATGTILNDDGGGPTSYFTLQPCRLLDTRESGPALQSDVERVAAAAGICGIPSEASTLVLNVTAVAPTGGGHLQVYAAGTAVPDTSVVSFSAGRTRAGFALARLGTGGALSLMCRMPGSPAGTAHVLVDVTGYFRQAEQ